MIVLTKHSQINSFSLGYQYSEYLASMSYGNSVNNLVKYKFSNFIKVLEQIECSIEYI